MYNYLFRAEWIRLGKFAHFAWRRLLSKRTWISSVNILGEPEVEIGPSVRINYEIFLPKMI